MTRIYNFIASLISRIDPTIYEEGSFSAPYLGKMISSWFEAFWQDIVSWFYWLCKWLLAFVDFLQYFIQKLIGLDYWLNNTSYTLSGAVDNDILFSFLFDDTVQRVFRAMVAVFFVLLIIFTIVQIIRQEWQYITGEKFGDGKGNSKTIILRNSIKAIAIVVLFPIILVVSIISSNAILASLVKALNIDMSSTFGATLFQISSQNASKYQNYANNNLRLPASDQITFYTVVAKDQNDFVDSSGPILYTPLYLRIVSGLEKTGYRISNASFDYLNDNDPTTEPVSFGVGLTTYYDLVKQYENQSGGSEREVTFHDGTPEGKKLVMCKHVVNSMFDYINPSSAKNFEGFCVGLKVEDSMQYYMVQNSGSTHESMYHYLHDVLQVPIMGSDRDLGNEIIHDDVKAKFKSIEDISCLISGLNIDSINSSGRSFGVDDACYNTWTYPSAYNVGREFDTCEKVIPVRDSEWLAQIGLGSFTSVKAIINGDDYSQQFDGGQLGNVQLQTEYLVMAEVLGFMQENDVGLYVMNANSTSIDWSYGDYAPETRWVSDNAEEMQTNTSLRAASDNCLSFVISYDETTAPEAEVGNVLYMSRYNTTSELDGAKYIMCWKVARGNRYVYVPLINGKTFTDPATNKSYRFSSDYYTSTYRGVVLAKGGFDNSVNGTDSTRGNPTYLKNSIKNVNADGTSAIIDSSSPYYFHAITTGSVQSYATVTNSDGTRKSYEIRGINNSTSSGGVQPSETYSGEFKETTSDGCLRYELQDSLGSAINFNDATVEGLSIALADADNPDRLTTATYADQKVDSTDNDGGHWKYFLFRTGTGYYFRVAKCDIDGKNYIEIAGQHDDEKYKMSAAKFTYDITLEYTGLKTSDGKKELSGTTVLEDVTLDEFVHSSGNLYRLPGQSVNYKYSDGTGEETHYETVYVYLDTNNSEFITMSGERQPANLGLSLKPGQQVGGKDRMYSTNVYTFYLYNFMTGLVQSDTNADSTNNVYVYKEGATEPKSATLPTEDGWTFTVKVSTEDFYWPQGQLSYNLYNGSTYVATLYKTADQVVNTPDALLHNTIRINYGGEIYYNMYTNNRYSSTTELNSSYNALMSDFIVGCYRDNIKISFLKTDINSVLNLIFTGRMRFYFQFGVSTISRSQLALAFSLQEGIKFDYFFSGTTVGLQDLYIASSIQYWLLIVGSILIIKVLGKAIWGVIKRFYTITLYFLAMPASASLIPFGGDKFKTNIQTPLIQEILSTYGVILGINVFFILLMPVKSISNIFTQADIETSGSYFLKHLPFSSSTTAKVLNTYVYILFVLVAFTMIENLPTVISTMIGGSNVVSEGENVKKSVTSTAKTVGRTWSGQGLIEGVKGAGHTITSAIPGLSLMKGGRDLAKAGANKIREYKRKGEEEVSDGGSGESSTPSSEGGGTSTATSSREGTNEEIIEEVEGGAGVANAAVNIEGGGSGGEAGDEADATGTAVSSRMGITDEFATSDNPAERAAYSAATFGAGGQDFAVQQSFVQGAINGGVSQDVLGADFNLDSAKANTFRNGVSSNAAIAGAASSLLNSNDFANASDEAKIDAIKSTMSVAEQQQFDNDYNNASDKGKKEMLDSYAFLANSNGRVAVGKKLENGSIDQSNMRTLSTDMSRNLIDDALEHTSDGDIVKAININKDVASAVNAAFARNIAVGLDFDKDVDSGAASRVFNIAQNDRNIQNEALIDALANNPNLVAKYGITGGDNGADREKISELIRGNERARDELFGRISAEQYNLSLRKVVGEKVKRGEFQVSAWDLQREADPEKLREFEARYQAQMQHIAQHNVLENTSSMERADILTAIANNMQATNVGASIRQTIGRENIGTLSAEDVQKLDAAGLSEFLARAATIDRNLTKFGGRETATRYEATWANYTPKTAEELGVEIQMSRDLVRRDFSDGENGSLLLAQTFANSNIEGKEDIASEAVRGALSEDLDAARRDKALKEVRRNYSIQELNAQGYSDDDIVLAQTASTSIGGDFMTNLENLRDNSTQLLNSILNSKDRALKSNLSKQIEANITASQKDQLIGIAASSAFATMNISRQNEVLVDLARRDGSIMEQVGASASNDKIQAFLDQHNDVKERLAQRANETSYIASRNSAPIVSDNLSVAVATNRQIEESLRADGGSITPEDIMLTINTADQSIKTAFEDTYIEKADIFNEREKLNLRKQAAKDYLSERGQTDITDEDIATALSEDAGAMQKAEGSLSFYAKRRLSLGLGGKNAFIADAVVSDRKLYRKAQEEFRAQFGKDMGETDTLTQQAFLAKYESKLTEISRNKVNEDYIDSLGLDIDSKLRASMLSRAKKGASIDAMILNNQTLKQQLEKNSAGKDLLTRLTDTSDPEAVEKFHVVYDSLSREQGEEGEFIINAAKRNHISQTINGSLVVGGKLSTEEQAKFKAGTEIDPSKLTGTARRDYDYNKGILSKEVLQNGRTDLLQNVFNNVNFVGKDKIEAELKGGRSFEDILKTNEALKTKLLNLGAQDVKLTLAQRSLESKEADVVKNTAGLKNDLLAFIRSELASASNKNEVAKIYGIDAKNINNLNSLEEIKNLSAAINARKETSSTFAKALSDGVTKDVSYSSHASEEDKQRFFDNEASQAAAQERKNKRKYTNISDAYNGFVTTSAVGHVAQSVLFKITKRLPKESSTYVNYNKKIQKQIDEAEHNSKLTRTEKDNLIRSLEAKKVLTELPANFSSMTNEEQQMYKRQQEINKRVAFKEGNYNWMKKGGLAIKATFGNIGVATSKTASRVGLAIGTKLSFLPFARTDGVKTRHKDDLNVVAANISRFRSTIDGRDASEFKDIKGGGINTLSESFGLSAKRVKNFADKLMENKNSKGKPVYSSIEEARKAAMGMLLNKKYRTASQKVARDEKQNKKSYFDGYGVGTENVRYKEANSKYLQVRSHIRTHVPVPFINTAVNAAVTHSRMKNLEKVETARATGTEDTLSNRTLKRYDKIYGRKTEESGIKAQNNVVNAQNMISELQKFNSTYKGDSKLYMESLFNNFKQKFGEETTRELLNKIKISDDGKTFKLTRGVAAADGLGGFTDLTKRSFSIQTREVESLLKEQMKQQQRRALYSSAAIPASSDVATAFIGKTLTGAKTRVEVENEQRNAENLNKLLRQIESQRGIVKLSADPQKLRSDIERMLGSSILADKFMHSHEYKAMNKATNDAGRYDAIQNFVRQELERANSRVMNNNYLRDQRSQLQRLNGIYVDRREITRGSAEARQAFRANQDPVYDRIKREYHIMRNIVRNQEADYQKLLRQIKEREKNREYMSTQTRREIRKLRSDLSDLQNQIHRNKDKLTTLQNRYNAKLDSFTSQSIASTTSSTQNYTISNNAPLDVKINARIPASERSRLEREIRQAVLNRTRESLTAINNRGTLTPEMESRIKSILGSYNFNDKLSKVPELMSRLQNELDSEISKLQNSTRRDVKLRMEELNRKLKESDRVYKRTIKNLQTQVQKLENDHKK